MPPKTMKSQSSSGHNSFSPLMSSMQTLPSNVFPNSSRLSSTSLYFDLSSEKDSSNSFRCFKFSYLFFPQYCRITLALVIQRWAQNPFRYSFMALYSQRHHSKRQGSMCSTRNTTLDFGFSIVEVYIRLQTMIITGKTLQKTFGRGSRWNIPELMVSKRVLFTFSELPKQSEFSSFMGLNKDLEKVRKKQHKKQASEVRTNSFVIIAALTLFGSAIAFFLNDEKVKFEGNLSIFQFKLSIFRGKGQRIGIVGQAIAQIKQYLNTNPYEYVITLKTLLFLTKQVKLLRQKALLSELMKIYAHILKRNFKAGEQSLFIEGIASLSQVCYLQKIETQEELLDLLLIKGSIKQMYLALACRSGVSSILSNEMLLKCIEKNCKDKAQENKQYFQTISAERLAQQYPQILFRQKQEGRWMEEIKDKLHLSLKTEQIK